MTVGWALDNVDKYPQRFLYLFLVKQCANITQGVVILCTSLQIGDGGCNLVGQFAKFSKRGRSSAVTIICKNRKQGK